MTIAELINKLQELAEDYGNDAEVHTNGEGAVIGVDAGTYDDEITIYGGL